MTAASRPEDQRLDSIEEAVGFNEHKSAKLDALVSELSNQVYELSGRLERLEKRIIDLRAEVLADAGPPSDETPPHSHRPL